MATWMLHEKWGTFPDGGCYNDQPAALLRDWDTLDRRYADISEHVRAEGGEQWLPPTLAEIEFADDAPIEIPPEALSLFSRLRGGG